MSGRTEGGEPLALRIRLHLAFGVASTFLIAKLE